MRLSQPDGMNPTLPTDYSYLAIPIVIVVVALLLNGLFFYAVITAAVQGALRAHYFWMRKQTDRDSTPR
jgi:hypothetical protein